MSGDPISFYNVVHGSCILSIYLLTRTFASIYNAHGRSTKSIPSPDVKAPKVRYSAELWSLESSLVDG